MVDPLNSVTVELRPSITNKLPGDVGIEPVLKFGYTLDLPGEYKIRLISQRFLFFLEYDLGIRLFKKFPSVSNLQRSLRTSGI